MKTLILIVTMVTGETMEFKIDNATKEDCAWLAERLIEQEGIENIMKIDCHYDNKMYSF